MFERAAESAIPLTPLPEVIERFRRGEMVIMVDHHERENEGDLVVATELLSEKALCFMMGEARGLICVSISSEVAGRLGLPLQALDNSSHFHTPFTVSVDARAVGARGVTAAARVATMRKLLDPDAHAADFVTPGHVFPLIANPDGVLARQGQTEGSFDLARLSGFTPSGVVCEIMNPDGSMARGAQLARFAEKHGLAVTSVEEIARYRVQHEILVREVACNELVTDYGRCVARVFEDDIEGKEHLALTFGSVPAAAPAVDNGSQCNDEPTADEHEPVLLRIHSECLTGDVFGSRRCDCGEQLDMAIERIVAEGRGIVLYLRQEGRGIGLGNKLRAYALQDLGHDTVDANLKLGFKADSREYAVAANILASLGVRDVRLMTNNPEKMTTLQRFGITVAERVPLVIEDDEYSRDYLLAKRHKLGHLF